MADFLLAYTGGDQPQSDEEGQAAMVAWIAWFGRLGAVVVDAGNPVRASAAVSPDGTISVGAPSGIMGYSVISADTLEAAAALAQGCPHLTANGTVEVYEVFDVM